ncbi:hypothetical protein N7G274_001822 [Stereocaulon virgatum]|uniref:Uncharacterized protein n=1 Tax=Stereocaulon virgatum TaxID=373712 RepID=A0ABR4ALK5_9LECA
MFTQNGKPTLTVKPSVLETAWPPSGTDFTSKNNILPHTQEAGDAYYIGDVYEKSRIGSSGELLDLNQPPCEDAYLKPPPPYLSYIESLSEGWPHVSYLADFMKVTTSPPKQKFLAEDDRNERARRTKVTILDFEPDTPVSRTDYSDVDILSKALHGPTNQHDHVHARLFVVEDLSRDVIEQLGARFDIDPLFFRGHISDYMWNNTRDPWVELPDLDIVSQRRSYLHVRYVQTRYFRDEASLKRSREQAGSFNVLRRIDRDGNWVVGADLEGSDVGLVRSKTSLWIRPNKNGETGVLGILLVDPTITEGFCIWGGYRNLQDCPSMTVDPIPQGPPRTSAFEDIIYWTSSLASKDIVNIARDPRVLFKQTLLIVCAEWYTLLKYATTRLAQLEWELENPQLQHSVGGLAVTINKLHGWRRRFPIFRTLISEVLEKVIKRDRFMSFPDNHLSDLKCDFDIILSDIEMLQTRADRIMAVVTATMSIEESQKANDQNRSLARLTWLAVTFVPLSFTSSLFSMNGDLASLRRSFWIFCAVALPMTAIVLLITALSDRTAKTFERIREGFPGKRKKKGI